MGKIVVIEGTDFSGKSTQYDKLKERLSIKSNNFSTDSFPNYEAESSLLVRQYLRGDFGTQADAIDAKLASTYYAIDRMVSFKERPWGKAYAEGGNILFARYITSNILHQACKLVTETERDIFVKWLYDTETQGALLPDYIIRWLNSYLKDQNPSKQFSSYIDMFMRRQNNIPKEDLVILLDMPPEKGQELKKKRLEEQGGLASSGTVVDIHELDKEYLMRAYATAKEMANKLGWVVIPCLNRTGDLRSITDIHEEIYGLVTTCYENLV